MKQTTLSFLIVVFVATALAAPLFVTSTAVGQAGPIRKAGQEVLEALGGYFSRTGGRELSRELAELGGEATVRHIAERALREGGDDTLKALVRTARSHGPDALRAADNAVNIPSLLRAVDDLPQEMAGPAIRRLAAGTDGRVLAQTVERYGAQVLRAEVRHPGVGGRLVANFGEDGATLAMRASRQQAITLGRHADDVARLPADQRTGVVRLLREYFEETVAWIARFIEKNPGKVLFTAAATPIILANSDKLLGGEGEIAFDPDGNPIYVPKPGLIERTVGPVVRQALTIALPLLALGAGVWLAVKLWFHYRIAKLRHNLAVGQLLQAASQKDKDEPTDVEDSDASR